MTAPQQLIQELHRLHDESGRTPTRALMAGQGAFEPEQYEDRFGSWEDALVRAGLEPANLDRERYTLLQTLDQDRARKIETWLDSNEYETFFSGQLLAELHRLAVELDKTPTCEEMTAYGRYSPASYRRHFGSWNAALTELGLPVNTRSDSVSEAELLADLRRVADEIGGCPRTADIREHGDHSVPTFYSHFDTWAAACAAAGVHTEDSSPPQP